MTDKKWDSEQPSSLDSQWAKSWVAYFYSRITGGKRFVLGEFTWIKMWNDLILADASMSKEQKDLVECLAHQFAEVRASERERWARVLREWSLTPAPISALRVANAIEEENETPWEKP